MNFFIIKCLLNEDRDIAWNFILVHLSFTIVVYNYLKPWKRFTFDVSKYISNIIPYTK